MQFRRVVLFVAFAAIAIPASASAQATRARGVEQVIRAVGATDRAAIATIENLAKPGYFDGCAQSLTMGQIAAAGGPDSPLAHLLRNVQALQGTAPAGTGPFSAEQVAFLESLPQRFETLAARAADPHVMSVLARTHVAADVFIMSDLHMGKGRNHAGGGFQAQDDFHLVSEFIRHIEWISTLDNGVVVLKGDIFDFMEFNDADHSMEQIVKTLIGNKDAPAGTPEWRGILDGHKAEWTAMATAANNGTAFIIDPGNHDIHWIYPEVRKAFYDKLAEYGLTAAGRANIAMAGHATPIGKYGELLAFHGEMTDATNSWRAKVNPHDGAGNLQTTLGWEVVENIYRGTERRNPMADNDIKPPSAAVFQFIARRWWEFRATRLLWQVTSKNGGVTNELRNREALDDLVAMQAWSGLTGFGETQATSLFQGFSGISTSEATDRMADVYAAMPAPITSRLPYGLHTLNALRLKRLGLGLPAEKVEAERVLLQMLTQNFPNVRYVTWGHDHDERIMAGSVEGKGPVAGLDDNTWTQQARRWPSTVVWAKTDANGRVTSVKMHEVDPTTGQPSLSHHAVDPIEGPLVDGWGAPLEHPERLIGGPGN